MPITFICGGAGSGKTDHIYKGIIGLSEQQTDKNILLIVPEQFTMQAQMDIVSRHPDRGIMKIEVLSFQRLAFRVFEEVGMAMQRTLEDTGKSMVLRKVVSEHRKDLNYFTNMVDKFGFIDNLKSIITEFHQYEYGSEDLSNLSAVIEERPILMDKINDLQLIYEAFSEYIKDHYITTEETLDLLQGSLHKSNLLKDAIIIFDGYYGFTPQQYSIINLLMDITQHLIFTITIDQKEQLQRQLDKTHLFYTSKDTFDQLCKLAQDKEIKINRPIMIQEELKCFKEDLLHLRNNIFRYPYEVYQGKENHVNVTSSINPLKECEYVCRQVYHLVKEKGYHYKDIAILTGDIEGYKQPLERLFHLYHIPYFIDSKREILSNPLIELIRSLLNIYVSNFSYESIMRFLKTGFSRLDMEAIDLLENYVLEKGIKGKKNWLSVEWIDAYEKKEHLSEENLVRLKRIEEAKHKFIDEIQSFTGCMALKDKRVKDLTEALYDVMIELECPKQLRAMQENFEIKNELTMAKEYAQIWKTVMELLDQVVEILGEEKISIKDYAGLIEAGLEQCKIGLVPPSINQIIVGDLERTRLHGIKALFIMGFNDGLIPAVRDERGLFTDDDRNLINEKSKGIGSSNKEKVNEEHFLVYNALAKPKERLYLSYSLATNEGKPMSESFLLKQIHRILPLTKEEFDDPKCCDERHITMPRPTLFNLIQEKRKDGELDEEWLKVEQWFESSEEWKLRYGKIKGGFDHENQETHLSDEAVVQLYGDVLHGSVSKLESYAACPFAYFLRYGLKAEERKLNEISPPDVGVFFHMVLEVFARKLQYRGLEWSQLDEKTRVELLEDSIEEVSPLIKYTTFLQSNRSNYLKYRLKKITQKAVSTLQEHLNQGEFVPKDFELDFGENGKLPAIKFELEDGKEMQLTGKVDRIDLLEEEDHYYAKIIDYKSGSEKFDVVAIYNGLQLQLIVYLDALTELGEQHFKKPIKPAGVFYFKVDDPIIQEHGEITVEQLQNKLFSEMKMSGLVLSDESIIRRMDKSMNTTSQIVPVRLNKSGSFSSYSSVADEEGFQILQNYVRKKTKSLGQDILSGKVSIEPYKRSTETGCDYCQYSSICQFDLKFKENEYNYIEDIKKDFWDLIQKELES
ncbi:helicase-exonuclease AddAB subunit AddB [Vallitalea okinawensis]|uniref:helicase-exonuclease AddAB subunit AddB n=1 Tax=Vallitalea okinawensis TaxID=2078660 RepID=UPI000CFCB08A|nr:helicase-exonuclease AddAB subunit AddB [Vallitalea okinawensis]